METENQTFVTEFILIGFSKELKTRISLFVLFFLVYLLTLFGNSVLICSVIFCSHLHTPMYYYLCNLSFLDLCYSSCNGPKLLLDLITMNQKISFMGCMVQMYTSVFLGQTESILLAVMAYDRYAAICLPLHYPVIMSWKVCKNITVILWLGDFLMIALPSILKPFVFCSENKINHFACEVLEIVNLACKDVLSYKTNIFFTSLFTLLAPFIFIMVSYACIIASIIKIHSVGGRTKAFSTCSSHLTVVFMFYGTSMTMYLGPLNYFSLMTKMHISIVYGIVTPMLNPMIYSLRNKEVKVAVNNIFTDRSSQIM